MKLDKATLNSLNRFVTAFREARDRGANESDTAMFIVKFFEEVMGYDSLKGEISKELAIKDRYCDIALKIEGSVKVLVECKAASVKGLVDKHIEQAENYASRAGIRWVVLTSGVEWKLYHLSFSEGEGIAHEVAFECNFIEEMKTSPEEVWSKLSLLSRDAVGEDQLEDYWSQKKAMSPSSVVRVLFTRNVLIVIRRELNKHAPARLEWEDVFNSVRDVIDKEALLESGEIKMPRPKKRKKRVEKPSPDGNQCSAVAENTDGSPTSSSSE